MRGVDYTAAYMIPPLAVAGSSYDGEGGAGRRERMRVREVMCVS